MVKYDHALSKRRGLLPCKCCFGFVSRVNFFDQACASFVFYCSCHENRGHYCSNNLPLMTAESDPKPRRIRTSLCILRTATRALRRRKVAYGGSVMSYGNPTLDYTGSLYNMGAKKNLYACVEQCRRTPLVVPTSAVCDTLWGMETDRCLYKGVFCAHSVQAGKGSGSQAPLQCIKTATPTRSHLSPAHENHEIRWFCRGCLIILSQPIHQVS